MGYKIVEFENGKFVAKEGNWFRGYSYIDRNARMLWNTDIEHCLVNSYEHALNIVNKRKMHLKLTSTKVVHETKL